MNSACIEDIFAPFLERFQCGKARQTQGRYGEPGPAVDGQQGVDRPQGKCHAGPMDERLREIPGWRIDQARLTARFLSGSFVRGVEFIDAIAVAAEEAGHHPDIGLSFPHVDVSLTTHDTGSLTEKDFALAGQISQIAARQGIDIDGGA